MEMIQISPELRFSRIIQGFWRLTNWNMSEAELGRKLGECLDLGVTTFDTAEIYGLGECEVQLGKALRSLPRDSYQIVTKTGIFRENDFTYYDTGYDRVIRSCETSLKKLGCEVIDLYLIHREDPLIDHHETARALLDLKKRGLIREAGVSNFDPYKFEALNHCMGGALRTNQIEWNPFCFEHFDSGMMDILTRDRIHPMIWSPLAGGRILTDESPEAFRIREKLREIAERHSAGVEAVIYSWIMMHPCKPLPIVGSRHTDRLRNAIDALDLKLERCEWFEIYAAAGRQIR